MGAGGLPKNYSDEGGGAMGKKSEIGGGVIQFSNYTPPNPTSPHPIKNERSLRDRHFDSSQFLRLLFRAKGV